MLLFITFFIQAQEKDKKNLERKIYYRGYRIMKSLYFLKNKVLRAK
jgi:hypothetical protein